MATISGGAKMDEALAKIAKKIGQGGAVRVGFLEGATYPDGTSVPLVAAVQNFGSTTVPPRPFFTNMVKAKAEGWGASLARILKNNG